MVERRASSSSATQRNFAGRDHATGAHVAPEAGAHRGACQVRQFLWDEIGLKGLYRGDGLTYDDDGRPGNREFLARQMPLSAIEGAVVVDVVPSRG